MLEDPIFLFRFVQNQAQGGPTSPRGDRYPDGHASFRVLEVLQKLFTCHICHIYHALTSRCALGDMMPKGP